LSCLLEAAVIPSKDNYRVGWSWIELIQVEFGLRSETQCDQNTFPDINKFYSEHYRTHPHLQLRKTRDFHWRGHFGAKLISQGSQTCNANSAIRLYD